jgi:hypothetical protein
MPKEQFIEGLIENCAKYDCAKSCCDDDQVEEWVNEYLAFHDKLKEHLISSGIKLSFVGDRVRFSNCSDGKMCKFLKYAIDKDIDPRPIDCKIYPYEVDWKTIDFDKKIIKLHYWDLSCPLVKKNSIPKKFKEDVEKIIKRDFATLFYGTQFKVEFVDKASPNPEYK